jgi:hypothetical protein
VKKNSFGLLELEMADLERFWRKTPLGPLGVNFEIYLACNYFSQLGKLITNLGVQVVR